MITTTTSAARCATRNTSLVRVTQKSMSNIKKECFCLNIRKDRDDSETQQRFTQYAVSGNFLAVLAHMSRLSHFRKFFVSAALDSYQVGWIIAIQYSYIPTLEWHVKIRGKKEYNLTEIKFWATWAFSVSLLQLAYVVTLGKSANVNVSSQQHKRYARQFQTLEIWIRLLKETLI